MMCCKNTRAHASTLQGDGCCCSPMRGHMSKKKQIQALSEYQRELEEKADDIREFIKELQSAK